MTTAARQHRGVTAGVVGPEPILLEAAHRVFARRFDHDIDVPAQVAEDRAAVAFDGRDDFDGAFVRKNAAVGFRTQQRLEIIDAAGRESQARRGRRQAEDVAMYLNRRLRSQAVHDLNALNYRTQFVDYCTQFVD